MGDKFTLNELKVYEHHINCIYKYGMLLDEHVELLGEFWKPPKVDRKEISWAVTVCPLLCGGFLTFRTKSVLPLVLTTVPFGVKLFHCLIKGFKYKKYNRSFTNLTHTLRKIFDFNKTVQKYYERRKHALSKLETSTKVLIEGPVIYKLTYFITSIFTIMEHIIAHIQNQLLIMNKFIPPEFTSIFNLNLNGRVAWCTERDVTSHFETVQMCYVLATSTFLSGIGLALSNCPDYVLKTIIPTSEKTIVAKFYEMKNIFEDINFSLPEAEPSKYERFVRTDSTVTINKFIESLQLTFYASLAVQQCISNGNEDNVQTELVDLEKLFSHSSNLLLILQHEHKNQIGLRAIKSDLKEETVRNDLLLDGKIVRYDDIEECVDDQEFNLSIHGSDVETETIGEDVNLEYDQLREQVRVQKIIIKELNDELLRRKLIKEELVDENKMCIKKKSESPTPAENGLFTSQRISFNNEFLAQIKAVAQNRGGTESVFGDDAESGDDEFSTE